MHKCGKWNDAPGTSYSFRWQSLHLLILKFLLSRKFYKTFKIIGLMFPGCFLLCLHLLILLGGHLKMVPFPGKSKAVLKWVSLTHTPVWKVQWCWTLSFPESFRQRSNPMHLSLTGVQLAGEEVQSVADSFCAACTVLPSWDRVPRSLGDSHRPQTVCRLLDSHQALYPCYGLHSHICPNETCPSEMRWAKWKTPRLAERQEKIRTLQRWTTSQTAAVRW